MRSKSEKYIDWKLILLLAAFYLLFDIITIIKILYIKSFVIPAVANELNSGWYATPSVSTIELYEDLVWVDFLVHNLLLDYVIVVSYMALIAISTKRFLHKNYSWSKIISVHIFFSLLIGMVIRLAGDFYSIMVGVTSWGEYNFSQSVFGFMYVIEFNFLIYFSMVFIIYTYYYLKHVKEAEKKQISLENQLVNARMKMLSSQLQPHFLFNTLNSIAVLTDIDAAKAKDTIADLSDFLREILYKSGSNRIKLDEELRILKYYLNIVIVRFSDHLTIRKNIDENLLHIKVPALFLQPLIENSIKHGYSYDHTDLEVKVKIKAEGNYLLIVVENDGEALCLDHKELLKKGVGLSNLNDRLQNLYGSDYFFEMRNKKDGGGVETVVKIPMN